jgi:hypothetical protein
MTKEEKDGAPAERGKLIAIPIGNEKSLFQPVRTFSGDAVWRYGGAQDETVNEITVTFDDAANGFADKPLTFGKEK